MGCPSKVPIGSNLVFSVCTHDPDTGVLTDADSVPTYRIYEDETATPILTGSMAKLDDANTTGFYTEQIECTADNGFEQNKTYTIYIIATIDSSQGGISMGFAAVVDAPTASAIVAALMADTGFTAGGTWTYEKLCKVLAAWTVGKWQLKTGETGVYEVLDPDDEETVIMEITPAATTPYKTVAIL